MNRYTIYCTEAQTKKALELGAPIEWIDSRKFHDAMKISNKSFEETYNDVICVIVDDNVYLSVTAEQMINFLEAQGLKFKIYEKFENSWYYCVGHRTHREPIKEFDNLKSRPEATLAAIDAALEYLSNKRNDYDKGN